MHNALVLIAVSVSVFLLWPMLSLVGAFLLSTDMNGVDFGGSDSDSGSDGGASGDGGGGY
jgi:hypothetical protein